MGKLPAIIFMNKLIKRGILNLRFLGNVLQRECLDFAVFSLGLNTYNSSSENCALLDILLRGAHKPRSESERA